MIIKCGFICILFTFLNNAFGQYKNDGILYKTVFLSHLCDSLEKYPDRIILDVRSQEEYNDVSMKGMSGMNLGRLKNTININVNDLSKRIKELDTYKSKAVFVVCSHSQRSRRASTFLANNGFLNVLNINGGMTSLRQITGTQSPCQNNDIITNIPYKLISPGELCRTILNDKEAFLLDVRADEDYTGKTKSIMNKAMGMIKNSKHIAIEDLSARITDVPLNKHIILTDLYGAESELAATTLLNKGFHDISVLGGGIEEFIIADINSAPCKKDLLTHPVPYTIIGAPDLNTIYPTLDNPVFLDIRSNEEFTNTHKDSYKNIGHFINALNVPYAEFSANANMLKPHKNSPIIIYSFNTDPNCYEAAKWLSQHGFSNIFVLTRGLYNARWTAHNMEGYDNLSKLIVNVPEENL